MSNLSGRTHCLRIAPPHLCRHTGQRHHPTVTTQWLDHFAPGRVKDSRIEAMPIYLFVYLLYLQVKQHPQTLWPRPEEEESVNLQDLLIQSSNWFGISSLQFSSLHTSLSGNGKLIQFSFGHQSQVPPISSFSSVHELFWL